MTQEEIKTAILPILRKKGKLYRKFKKVWARQSKQRRTVRTVTSDGTETTNVAEKGDYIVKNKTKAKERYVIKPKKFENRYEWERDLKNGYSRYKPTGKVIAIAVTMDLLKHLGEKSSFYFEAPWGSDMIVKKGDYLVCPPEENEVYRIAREEFGETYELDK